MKRKKPQELQAKIEINGNVAQVEASFLFEQSSDGEVEFCPALWQSKVAELIQALFDQNPDLAPWILPEKQWEYYSVLKLEPEGIKLIVRPAKLTTCNLELAA